MTIKLVNNQVAILDFNTREVEIITIPDLNEIEDVEERLEELGYDTNSILWMS